MTVNAPRLTIYYDGLCHLCSREINHYRSNAGAAKVSFVDTTSVGFDPRKEGLDPREINKTMHVKRSDGKIFQGVEAFIEIWHVLTGYAWLAQLFSLPIVKYPAKLGYGIFSRIRPLLPRRSRASCDLKGQKS